MITCVVVISFLCTMNGWKDMDGSKLDSWLIALIFIVFMTVICDGIIITTILGV